MGPVKSKLEQTIEMKDSVLKTKNENGLHVFTINLDANQYDKGLAPSSIVAIMVATILALIILKKLWQCCKRHRHVANAFPYRVQAQPPDPQPVQMQVHPPQVQIQMPKTIKIKFNPKPTHSNQAVLCSKVAPFCSMKLRHVYLPRHMTVPAGRRA